MRFFWRFLLSLYYRDIHVVYLNNKPGNNPAIFVSNHVNAFVDALAVSAALKKEIAFTAKATLFRSRWSKWLLQKLGVIPFQRSEDLKESDQKVSSKDNEWSFIECARRLALRVPLCIFPEGKSHTDSEMLPFRTGVARIAFKFMDMYPTMPLEIVPLGIYYEEKNKFRSRILIYLGEPLQVKEWHASEPKATEKDLTEEIEKRVKELTLNFSDHKEASLILWASALYQQATQLPVALGEPDPLSESHLRVTQEMTQAYEKMKGEPDIKTLEDRIISFQNDLRQLGLSIEEVNLPLNFGKAIFFLLRESELIILGGILFLCGFILHALPFFGLRIIVRKISKDLDHWATNFLFLGIPIFGLYYIMVGLGVVIFANLLAAVVAIGLFSFLGYFSILYFERLNHILRRIRTFILLLMIPKKHHYLIQEAREIVGVMKNIYKRKGWQDDIFVTQ